MRHNILFLSLILSMSSPSANADDTRITLYSGSFDAVAQSMAGSGMPGLAQVSQNLVRDLRNGSNEIALDRLPLAIDVGSIQLEPAGRGLHITNQRYDFALLGQDQLLQQAIGQRVRVSQAGDGQGQHFEGILLSAGNGLTLQQDDGRVQVLASYSSFELERLPGTLSARPTLHWNIESPRTGREGFRLDYATGGLAWQAEYLLRLDGPAQLGKLSASGSAQVVNRSGLDFPGTTLILVAGSPNRARAASPSPASPAPMARMMVTAASYDAGVEAQNSGEYHAYPLPKPVDLPNGSMQRVSLLDPVSGIGFQRRYIVGSARAYRPSHPQIQPMGDEDDLGVATVLEFSNDTSNGLGKPLPGGRVRVFQNDASGDSLLGEAWLGHVASGQKIELALGQAFDLSAKRKRVALNLAADRLSLVETVEVELANAKNKPVTLRLDEALPRWQDWEITEASQHWERLNAQAIRFDVDLPAAGKATVRYSVRYRWPLDVRP